MTPDKPPSTTIKDTTASQIYILQQEIQNCKDEQGQELKRQEQIYRRVNEALRHTVPLTPPNDDSIDEYEKIQQRMELVIKRGLKLQQILSLQVNDRQTRLENVSQDEGDDDDLETLNREEADLKEELERYDKELEKLLEQQQQLQQQLRAKRSPVL